MKQKRSLREDTKKEVEEEKEVLTSKETFESRTACSTTNEINSSFPRIFISL